MLIIEKSMVLLTFNKNEIDTAVKSLHKSDIIMYRGDSYIIYEICKDEDGTMYIKLELLRRASNFFCIDMNNNLFKVADYNFNCKKCNFYSIRYLHLLILML